MRQRDLEGLVDYYLPLLVRAGEYAQAIQSRVSGPGDKSGGNAWAQALTDADLCVQNYLEVATLAHDPRLGFYGEESGQSVNTRYFDANAETVVHVDPINGTFLYANQRDGWDIILNVACHKKLRAVISYMPARGQFYACVDGEAKRGNRDQARLAEMEVLRTQTGSRVCLSYRAPDVVAALKPRFAAFDLIADDDPQRGIDNLNELFTGRLDAFACRQGDLLDWGAVAYMVAAAGGYASRLDGSPLNSLENFVAEAQDDMLVASSPSVHQEIMSLLRQAA